MSASNCQLTWTWHLSIIHTCGSVAHSVSLSTSHHTLNVLTQAVVSSSYPGFLLRSQPWLTDWVTECYLVLGVESTDWPRSGPAYLQSITQSCCYVLVWWWWWWWCLGGGDGDGYKLICVIHYYTNIEPCTLATDTEQNYITQTSRYSFFAYSFSL